jgi:acyl carrier protein
MVSLDSVVIETIAKRLTAEVDRSKVTRDAKLTDLAIDSLDFVEIVFELEEKFDISVPYNANDPKSAGLAYDTVGQVVDGIAELVRARDAKKPA